MTSAGSASSPIASVWGAYRSRLLAFRRSPHWMLLVMAVVVLGCCTRAQASSVLLTLPPGAGGNGLSTVQLGAVAGGGVVSVELGAGFRVKRFASGGRVSVLEARRGDLYREAQATVAGSTTAAAVLYMHAPYATASPVDAELLAGPAAGPLVDVSPCVRASATAVSLVGFVDTAAASMALSGSSLAYVDDGCQTASHVPAVVVRDVLSGAVAELSLAAGEQVSYLRVAGDLVGYRSDGPAGPRLLVRNWRDGTMISSVAPAATRSCGDTAGLTLGATIPTAEFCGLALERDGSLWELIGAIRFEDHSDYKDSPGTDTVAADKRSGTVQRLDPGGSAARITARGACFDLLLAGGGRAIFDSAVSGDPGVIRITDATGLQRTLGYPLRCSASTVSGWSSNTRTA